MSQTKCSCYPWWYTEEDRRDHRKVYEAILRAHPASPTPDLPDLYQLDSHFVFVYGTLLSGRRNHDRYLGKAKYIGKGITQDKHFKMFQTLGGVPFVMSSLGHETPLSKHIAGEIYRVTVPELCELDRLESNGTLYQRLQIAVKMTGVLEGETVRAYMYLGKPDIWNSSLKSNTAKVSPSFVRKKTGEHYYAYTFPFPGRVT